MIRMEEEHGKYRVFWDGQDLGTVELYDNPVHSQNCYVRLELTQWESSVARELFQKLASEAGRPLQVMADWEDARLTEFLAAGGLRCARRCYEMEPSVGDYIGPCGADALCGVRRGEPDYDGCCRLLYAHYRAVHGAVNPWTGDFDRFCRCLPEDVFCRKTKETISALAFIEGNEIAYIWAADKDVLRSLAAGLLPRMFRQYETVCFESDDCDWAAMELRALFRNQSEASFDTYIYP